MAVDPNWANVELFVTPNYATDSGSVLDLSPRGHRCVVSGGSLSNDSGFSSVGSVKFTGAGNIAWYNESFLVPASTDFTLDFFFQYPTNIGCPMLFIASGGLDAAQRIAVLTDASAKLYFNRYGQANVFITAGTAFTSAQKHHFRMNRTGDTLLYFVDGVWLGSHTDATAFGSGAGCLLLSVPSGGTSYLSGIRFTKGVCLSPTSATFTPPDDRYSSTASQVAGIVRDSAGSPISRVVRAYRRDTGAFVGAAISDPSTGAYSISAQSVDELSVLAIDDVAGLVQNDLVKRAIPA